MSAHGTLTLTKTGETLKGTLRSSGISGLEFDTDAGFHIYPPSGKATFEPDPEPLPTEPGLYESSAYPLADGFYPYLLDHKGEWWVLDTDEVDLGPLGSAPRRSSFGHGPDVTLTRITEVRK